FLLLRLPPRSTRFPYTTLFRSRGAVDVCFNYDFLVVKVCNLCLDGTLRVLSVEFFYPDIYLYIVFKKTFFTHVFTSYNRNLPFRSEEHTSELQSRENLVCRLLL